MENSYALNAGQREYVARVRRVAGEHLAEVPAVHGAVNRPLLLALGDHGLLRGLFGGTPEEAPRDAAAMQLCLLRETLATVTTEAETALALQGLGSYPILQSGQPAAVERWIPGVVTGETVAGFALSEPDAGSDAAGLALRADRDTDRSWRLHVYGICAYPTAGMVRVTARSEPYDPHEHGSRRASALCRGDAAARRLVGANPDRRGHSVLQKQEKG